MKSKDKREIEVKFWITNPQALERRLLDLNARYTQARTHEVNLRYDTPDLELTTTQCMLRLRKDNRVRLTFKGPTELDEGVADRLEIEFEASDYEAARRFIEALGYEIFVIYEKYRTIYTLDGVVVTIDEMPYGNFVEIEGPDAESIRHTTQVVGLDWEKRRVETYLEFFKRLQESMQLGFRDLTFDNFVGLDVDMGSLGLEVAD